MYKNKPGRYKQNLLDDLQKYGNLKLTIENLQDNKKLSLKLKKKTLQPQHQKQKRKKKLSTVKDTIQK